MSDTQQQAYQARIVLFYELIEQIAKRNGEWAMLNKILDFVSSEVKPEFDTHLAKRLLAFMALELARLNDEQEYDDQRVDELRAAREPVQP